MFLLWIDAVQDHPDITISQYFDDCFDFVDEAKETGGGVLVHCFAGRSRRLFADLIVLGILVLILVNKNSRTGVCLVLLIKKL